MNGPVYLLHVERRLAHPRHYYVWASNLDQRLETDRKAIGVRLLEGCAEHGVSFDLARTW